MVDRKNVVEFPSAPNPEVEPEPKVSNTEFRFVNPVESIGQEVFASCRQYSIDGSILTENPWDVTHLQSEAKTRLLGRKRRFDPVENVEDFELVEAIQRGQDLRVQLTDEIKLEQHQRDTLANSLPPDPGRHSTSTVIVISGLGVLGFSNAASLQPLLAPEFIGKSAFSWIIALGFGMSIAALALFSLIGLDEGGE